MKYKCLTFLLSIFPFFSYGQDFKPNPKYGEVIDHKYYSLSYFEQNEQAEWVYYRLTPSMINGTFERTEDFRADPFVTTGSASLADYEGTGYDRGHLAPASDMKISFSAMSESFYLSNICPQNSSFNRGGWRRLESLIRSWVLAEGDMFVITGPIFHENHGKIGINEVIIPGYFYKVIYSAKGEKMIGFVMPNQKIDHDLQSYVQSVDAIEAKTGIDFFYQLDDELENKLENHVVHKDWNFAESNSLPTIKKSDDSSFRTTQSAQCNGIAKSTKNRCKNRTKNSNGYCYIHQGQSPGYVKPEKTNYVGRCNATTKAGTQCKRSASSGSRYCWQHP